MSWRFSACRRTAVVEDPQEDYPGIRTVLVVVPARNEQRRIIACLKHLEASMELLGTLRPEISVRVHMVFDGCSDATAAVVASNFGRKRWLSTHAVGFSNVGKARGFVARRALEISMGDPAETLIACTDADSRVPLDWLSGMVRFMEDDSDAVLGTIAPDPDGLSPSLYSAWLATYNSHDGHGHVHGANLGIRASWYLSLGGFHSLESGEDAQLVERLASAGARITRSASLCVATSSRLLGRAPRGFAAYLRRLDAAVPDEGGASCQIAPVGTSFLATWCVISQDRGH